jgi:trk system potassium uptake protein TrkA
VAIAGSPVDEDVLRRAGSDKADLLVAATADDSTNVMAIQVAKEVFHVPLVLARVSDPERERFYRKLGLSTVCPTSTGINQILELVRTRRLASLPGVIDAELVGVRLEPSWHGKPLCEFEATSGRTVVGILSGGRLETPSPQRPVGRDDTLILGRRNGENGGRPCTS